MNHLPSRKYMIFMVIFALVLASSGSWILLRANGYSILTNPFRLVKTGVISLQVHPASELSISLNKQTMQSGETDFTDLVPGRYTIRIEKLNFSTWEKTVEIRGGEALRYDDIVLFYANPAHRSVTDNEGSVLVKVLASRADFRSGLQALGGEIWNEDKLVTRYSESVIDALWLPGRTHVLALVGNKLHVLEQDGGQDLVLATLLEGAKSVEFAPVSGGSELVISVDGNLEIYEITESKSLLRLPTFQRLSSPIE